MIQVGHLASILHGMSLVGAWSTTWGWDDELAAVVLAR